MMISRYCFHLRRAIISSLLNTPENKKKPVKKEQNHASRVHFLRNFLHHREWPPYSTHGSFSVMIIAGCNPKRSTSSSVSLKGLLPFFCPPTFRAVHFSRGNRKKKEKRQFSRFFSTQHRKGAADNALETIAHGQLCEQPQGWTNYIEDPPLLTISPLRWKGKHGSRDWWVLEQKNELHCAERLPVGHVFWFPSWNKTGSIDEARTLDSFNHFRIT